MEDRRPQPHAPDAAAEALRLAYLDLLKLAICDLVAAETSTVTTTQDGPISQRLSEPDIGNRIEGREWPLRGLTMIGYDRLSDLQRCIESIVADDVPGDVIEAGVWRGGASMVARATLDSLGDRDRAVWLADSFQGLPPPDEAFPEDRAMDLHVHEYLAVPRGDVEAGFRRLGLAHDLRFVEGFFSETMPELAGGSWSLIRLDGDMYESTWVTLDALYPGLSQGGYVVFDDYGDVAEGRRAMDEYRAAHGIDTPLERVDHTCVRWRREDAPASAPAAAPLRRRSGPAPRGPTGPPVVRTAAEAALEREVTELRSRVAELESAPPAEAGREASVADRARRLAGRLRR